MIFYLINTILAGILTKSFLNSRDGKLRLIMIDLFFSIAMYQGFMVLLAIFDCLEHGTWYSDLSRFPFTLAMLLLIFYVRDYKLTNIKKRCLNFLTQLRKNIHR